MKSMLMMGKATILDGVASGVAVQEARERMRLVRKQKELTMSFTETDMKALGISMQAMKAITLDGAERDATIQAARVQIAQLRANQDQSRHSDISPDSATPPQLPL